MDELVNEQLDLFGNADTYNNLNKETKVCKICQKEKSLDLFYKLGINTLDNRCKACHKKQMSFKKEQKEIHWHKNTGSCDCCGDTPEKKSSLCWDHDHETLKHRGFICNPCNVGIGKLGDKIDGVTKALQYLERHYGMNERKGKIICPKCDTPMIQGGDHDAEIEDDPNDFICSNFSCNTCDTFLLLYWR